MADPGLWDTFKDAKGAAKSMVEITTTGDSACVRDLAGKMKAKQDKDVSGNSAGVTGEALERVGQAVRIVSERAPENLDAVESLIIGAATASAEAAHGAALLGVSLSAPEVSLRRYGVARRRKP